MLHNGAHAYAVPCHPTVSRLSFKSAPVIITGFIGLGFLTSLIILPNVNRALHSPGVLCGGREGGGGGYIHTTYECLRILVRSGTERTAVPGTAAGTGTGAFTRLIFVLT